jgi:hypothetical protein
MNQVLDPEFQPLETHHLQPIGSGPMLLEPQPFIDALMLFEQAKQTRMHIISPLGQNIGLIGGSALMHQ